MSVRFGQPLRLVSNEELDQRAAAEAAELLARQQQLAGQQQSAIDALAAHCRRQFRSAWDAKQPIQTEMLRGLRQIKGEYEPDFLADIEAQGGTAIYMQLTAEKYYGAIAWIMDLLTQERPFGGAHSPLPDIPAPIQAEIEQISRMELEGSLEFYQNPDALRRRVSQYRDEVIRRVKEESEKQALRVEDKVDDEFVEGGFYQALEESVEDGLALGSGFVIGPDVRNTLKMQWSQQPGQDEVVEKPARTWYSPSALDIYPSASARTVNDGHLTERQRWSRKDFRSCVGLPPEAGFKEDAIREILDRHGRGGLRNWMSGDQTRSNLENHAAELYENTDGLIDVARHWTSVPVRMLIEWGMPGLDGADPDQEIDVETYFCGDTVFCVRTLDDPLKQRNIFKWDFRRIKGSFWGWSLPRSMKDSAAMCNAAARALADNMGLGSGPMIEIEVDRLAAGEKITKIAPWRIWQTVRNPNGSPGAAVRAINIELRSEPLLRVFEFFMGMADKLTGIPAYSYGVPETRGAATTSSGLAQLRSDAARGLKRVLGAIDSGVIKPGAEYTHRHIRKYNPDPEIMGDVNWYAKGTEALVAREAQQAQAVQLLNQSANPMDAAVLGLKGRAHLWRAALKTFEGANRDDIVPTGDELMAREAIQQALMMDAAGGTGTPAKPMKMLPGGMQEAGGRV